MTITLSAPSAMVQAADGPKRTISGLVAPWGQLGNTSAGPLVLRAGSIRLPEDLSRVKLVDYHQNPPVAIGYATSAETTEAGLVMSFQLGTTTAAAQALLEASEGLRDALSVELDELTLEGHEVTDSLLTAVAQVPIPAFADARVTSVAAAHQRKVNTMPEDTVQAAATATVAVTGPIVEAPPAEEAPTPDAGTEAGHVAQLAASMSPAQLMAALSSMVAVGNGQLAASAPAGVPTGARAVADRAQVQAALERVLRGQSRPELEAALSDITNTQVYTSVGESSYVGQLWSAVTFARRFVPLLRPGVLTSWKVTGWKWVTPPEVDDYAGDKAAIPSAAVDVDPASTTAARLAGGHDLDRKFRDFNDTEFLDAYFQAMTESYARKSDAKALAFIIASASEPAGNATSAGGDVLEAAALAASLLEDQTDGGTPDYFLVNRTDLRGLINVKASDAKAYLDLFGVKPEQFQASSSVPAGEVYAGMRGAGTFYELPGSPIRVEALDVAKGGLDEALFGYYATLLHDARGIVKVDITPSA